MTETHGSQRVLHWNKDGDGYNKELYLQWVGVGWGLFKL